MKKTYIHNNNNMSSFKVTNKTRINVTIVSWTCREKISVNIFSPNARSLLVAKSVWAESTSDKPSTTYSISVPIILIISSAKSADWSSISIKSTNMWGKECVDSKEEKDGKGVNFVDKMLWLMT